MAITSGQYDLNGLIMGLGTDYHVQSTDVFSWPKNRGMRNDEPNMSGYRFDTKDLFSGRTIEIEMIINSTDLVGAMRAISEAAYIDGQDEVITFDMWFSRDTSAKRAEGRLAKLAFPGYDRRTYSGSTSCVLQFDTELPSLLSVGENSSSVALPTSEGGHLFNVTFPMTFGAVSTGGLMNVTNDGNYPFEPNFRIDGPVTDPKILHQDQDRWLEFSGLILGASDWIDINVRDSTVLLNGTASRYNYLTSASRWFSLNPGSNSLSYSAAGYQAGSSCTVYWHDAYLV